MNSRESRRTRNGLSEIDFLPNVTRLGNGELIQPKLVLAYSVHKSSTIRKIIVSDQALSTRLNKYSLATLQSRERARTEKPEFNMVKVLIRP